MSNKRSWTIEHNCDYDYCVRGPTLKRDELVRVIEYSAYEDELERADKNARRIGELATQLAEVTRERDEARAEIEDMKDVYYDIVKLCNASGTEDVRVDLQSFLDEYDAERAKAERYKEAIKLYEQAFDDTGCDYSHLVCLQAARKALTEAEGE